MIYKENSTTGSTENDNETFDNINDYEEKIKKLNKKLQATADELEEVSALYAKSVKVGLDKAKKIKELEDRIAELENQLKKCQQKGKEAEELENQLKDCQDKRQELESQLKDCQDKRQELEKGSMAKMSINI